MRSLTPCLHGSMEITVALSTFYVIVVDVFRPSREKERKKGRKKERKKETMKERKKERKKDLKERALWNQICNPLYLTPG